MKIRSLQDFFSGLMFLGAGVVFAWGASRYPLGQGERMGAGYFPLVLGVLLALLGAVITLRALVMGEPDGGRIGAIAWRPLFFVILANVVFGVLLVGLPSIGLPAMGLVVAIYALTFVASAADGAIRVGECLALGSVLSVGSYLAFVLLLKLQFPVWPAFITG